MSFPSVSFEILLKMGLFIDDFDIDICLGSVHLSDVFIRARHETLYDNSTLAYFVYLNTTEVFKDMKKSRNVTFETGRRQEV